MSMVLSDPCTVTNIVHLRSQQLMKAIIKHHPQLAFTQRDEIYRERILEHYLHISKQTP